ncbi:hypothetical protein M422DRAFT_262513 [Sphaerobolus stellatus SS14]|uniref:Uncharacterized protein n=1 Tax=Sphaerobolus stellatus (strain SS14) TaxID=990650 RepID=A0A0C9UKH2_SPHS4|nr:hypothetical protein M422DRAFT_262513 [Sphaerobolus stellatus SS14]
MSSSKSTTATTILYKKSKDVPRLPLVELSDVRKPLKGFKAVPEFTGRWDPTRNDDWADYEQAERDTMIKGYWWAYDKEHDELENHYLALVRKEAEAESKRKSEEEKKKKSKPATPIASGSRKSKGKGKAVEEVDDSEFEGDTEFQETCIGCKLGKVKCIFTHATNGKKVACDSKSLVNLDVEVGNQNHLEAEGSYHRYQLQMFNGLRGSLDQLMKADERELRLRTLVHQLQDESLVSEDLQDGVFNARSRIIDRYNKIALTCGAQMKQIVARYKLGKSFVPKVMLLDQYGEVVFEEDVGPGMKRMRDENEVGFGPSKRARFAEKPGSRVKEVEKVVEKEVGPDPVPMEIDKGTGKGKETEPKDVEEDIMKE